MKPSTGADWASAYTGSNACQRGAVCGRPTRANLSTYSGMVSSGLESDRRVRRRALLPDLLATFSKTAHDEAEKGEPIHA